MDEDLRLLLRRQPFGDVADAGVEDPGIEDAHGDYLGWGVLCAPARECQAIICRLKGPGLHEQPFFVPSVNAGQSAVEGLDPAYERRSDDKINYFPTLSRVPGQPSQILLSDVAVADGKKRRRDGFRALGNASSAKTSKCRIHTNIATHHALDSCF